MKRTVLIVAIVALIPGAALAQGFLGFGYHDKNWSINVATGAPYCGGVVYAPPPVYYAPPPVYYGPPPPPYGPPVHYRPWRRHPHRRGRW